MFSDMELHSMREHHLFCKFDAFDLNQRNSVTYFKRNSLTTRSVFFSYKLSILYSSRSLDIDYLKGQLVWLPILLLQSLPEKAYE